MLSGQIELHMLFHRRQDAEIALEPHGVVVADVILNHIYKAFSVREFVPVIAFTLENAPEALHGSVVYAVGHSGHALDHACFFQLRMEYSVRVLKSSVAVKDGMRIGVCPEGGVKGVINQRVVVAVPDHISNDASVIQIKYGTEIDLTLLTVLVPFEFRNIRQPFLIRLVCMEVPVENILCQILRICGIPCTTMVRVLDGGLYVTAAADPQGTFVADVDIVVSFQIITDTTVTFVRTFGVDLFGKVCNTFILFLTFGQSSGKPVVVSIPGYAENAATRFYRITVFLMTVPDGHIQIALSYLRKASLLSSSSNFFSRSRSISAIYSLCFNSAISIFACSNSLRGSWVEVL